MSLQIEATQNCDNTPRALFALEELGVEYAMIRQPDGHFLRTYGVPGPRLVDGEIELFETNAILRHLGRSQRGGRLYPASVADQARLDRWLDFFAGRLTYTHVDLGRAIKTGNQLQEAKERQWFGGLLSVLERQLGARQWLLGEFSILDCSALVLLRMSRRFPLADHPGLAAYLDRLTARPACARLQFPPSYS